MYRAEGPEEACGPWYEVIDAIAGPCVSPGGASMFAPVSRAAVSKRVKEGKLTVFLFHPTSTRVGLFGKQRKIRENPYGYIPCSELKAWGAELEERILRLGKIAKDELEGRQPDWKEEVWNWQSKWRMERLKKQADNRETSES